MKFFPNKKKKFYKQNTIAITQLWSYIVVIFHYVF